MRGIQIQYIPMEEEIIEGEYTEKTEPKPKPKPKKKRFWIIPVLLTMICLTGAEGYVIYRQEQSKEALNSFIAALQKEAEKDNTRITELQKEVEQKESKIKELSAAIASQEKTLEKKDQEKSDLETKIQEQESRLDGVAKTISDNLNRSSYTEVTSFTMLEKLYGSWKDKPIKIAGTLTGIEEVGNGMENLYISLNGNTVLLKYHYAAIGVAPQQGAGYEVYGRMTEIIEGVPVIDVDFLENSL